MQQLYGAIEFGGTKTICATGYENGELIAQVTLATTTVDDTLKSIYNFFDAHGPISALGVGAFGPLQLDTTSLDYGSMYNTPKPGWENVTLKNLLEDNFKIPVAIDLDVNVAALGELYFGKAQDVKSFVYLTLGTGIGGGLVLNGQLVHGIRNLEMGHMRIPHEDFIDGFKGTCTFHADCFEGIASGHALKRRYKQEAEQLTSETAWSLESSYVASAIYNIMLTIGPEKIILGGGLVGHQGFLQNIRAQVTKNINNYLAFPDMDTYIVESSGNNNGVLGGIKLASIAIN